VRRLSDLKVAIYADGANLAGMLALSRLPYIHGFTTNPTLMRQAGVEDYQAFARQVLQAIPDRPVSFEVLADEFDEMERQARRIAAWGENVFVKIPITNTRGESSGDLIHRLVSDGIHLNVTALTTLDQVAYAAPMMAGETEGYISVFAGRIADTGRDPVPVMGAAVQQMVPYPNLKLVWASPREVLNIFQADDVGCHIITVTHDLLRKLHLVGKDLAEFSLETVKMFYRDARQAGYDL
jgi:transaldolase